MYAPFQPVSWRTFKWDNSANIAMILTEGDQLILQVYLFLVHATLFVEIWYFPFQVVSLGPILMKYLWAHGENTNFYVADICIRFFVQGSNQVKVIFEMLHAIKISLEIPNVWEKIIIISIIGAILSFENMKE